MESKFTNQNVDARAGPGTILSALVQAFCHHRRRKTSVIDDEIDSEKYYEQQIIAVVVSILFQ